MRAVIYARVSSEKQADNGTSIPAQIKICKEYLARSGYSLYKTYIDEAKSALSTDRPAFQDMIEDAKKTPPPFNAIIIYSFSRFARNRLDSITYKLLLRKKGIKVISVTEPLEEDTPEGKLLEGIIEVINEFYSSNLARETFRGQRENATQGFWNGGVPPIGYKVLEIKNGEGKKKVLEIDEESENAVKEIYELFLKGYGLKKIAGMLNAKELKTNRGNSFSPSTVRGILKNEAYAGTLIWNKYDKKTRGKKYKDKKDWVKIDGRIPKIIDKKDFDIIQKMFEERKKVSPKSLGRTHTLSGLIKCGLCNSNYIYARRSKVRGDKKYETSYYVCGKKDRGSKKACPNIALKAPQIEDYIVNLLTNKLLSPENVKKIVYDMHKNYSDVREEVKNKSKSVRESIRRIDAKINNIYKAVENGFNQNLLEERLEELKIKKEDLLNELEALKSEKAKPYSEKDVVAFANSIKEKIKSLTDEELNHYLKFFIRTIKVTPEEMSVYFTFTLPDSTLSSFLMVPRDGIEPPTRGFSVRCSTD